MLVTIITAQAQDLLANQAPIDRKMRAVDSLVLKRLFQTELSVYNAAEELYASWNNNLTHYRDAVNLPDEFSIDLTGFTMPTDNQNITSNFGYRWNRQHTGIDVKVYIGDTIRSAFDGKVRVVKYDSNGYGKFVVIRHTNGLETYYGHLSKQLVKENETVKSGQPIGLGGNTGRSTGSHLHFETRLCGIAINPALMFDFKNQDVTNDTYVYKSKTKQTEVASNVQTQHLYKVKKGDNLSIIAKKLNTTVGRLCQVNHISKKTRLLKGQIIKYE